MKVEGATVHDITEARRGRKRSRVSPLASKAVAVFKAEQAKALQAGLNTTDGEEALIARVTAVNMERAANIVMMVFDELSRKPSL